MTRRSRLVEFPGGVLEVLATDENSDDDPGVYLEYFQPSDQDDDRQQGAEMRYKQTALGYLRTDVSGIGQLWDESRIRRTAARLGYDFSGMVIYDPLTGRPPLARLRAQATRLDAEAVIVPGPEHFDGGQVPGVLVNQLDVITVDPEKTYARRATPPSSDSPTCSRM